VLTNIQQSSCTVT